MIGKIYITRQGYDPQLGKHVKDPYLGPRPTLGACRPDVRKKVVPGDYIFAISGRVKEAPQYVMGGFEVERKIDMREAYKMLPEHRLKLLDDGQVTGNIIVNGRGRQHKLDTHETFKSRLKNYIIGCNPIILSSAAEIARGRLETLVALQDILKRRGRSPIEIVGRWGTWLDEDQVKQVRMWLLSLKVRK